MDTTLDEARRLWEYGFALLPLHPKSKRPKANGWTTGDRGTWDQFKKSLSPGDNIGVRTGVPSRIGKYYLACIDVDVKNPAFKDQALEKLQELIAGCDRVPEVRSGSGNGSRHIYCLTSRPFKMITVEKNSDWEICVYSNGRQMVLPPSTHPSGKPYKWVIPLNRIGSLPVIEFKISEENEKITKASKDHPSSNFQFTPQDVDVEWLPELSKGSLDGIVKGLGVEDRSAFLLTATMALVSAGLTRDEILSVLTNPKYFISKCGEARRGKNRLSQAQWLWEYTVKKVMTERSIDGVFTKASDLVDKKLSDEEAKEQSKELKEERHWSQDLKRVNGGPPVGNVENIVTILTHAVGSLIVRRNEFAYRDIYGLDTPWGGKIGHLLGDDDSIKIKYWLGTTYGFEPKTQIIEEALVIIACQNSYDPVKDWLASLPKWDGVARLGTWLKDNFQATGDHDYLSQVFTKWILAHVARAYQPGTKFDWMPIFEGKQGVGKSSFGRLLVGGDYFLDSLPNITDKDSALALQGIWSVEMGELANMRRTQLEDVKSYITRTIDKVRPPYGRRWKEHARRCVFFGTTNRQTYLVDDTGNRRFKPVEVGKLNFKKLKEDRDQLFSEAKFLYDTKGIGPLTFELTGNAKVFEAKIHQEKMVEDDASVMKEAIQDFIRKAQRKEVVFDFEKFRILDLFGVVGPLPNWKADNRNCQFAAKSLTKLGAQFRLIKGQKYWKIPLNENFDVFPSTPPTPDFY
jgi:predicted P-loop ATPase